MAEGSILVKPVSFSFIPYCLARSSAVLPSLSRMEASAPFASNTVAASGSAQLINGVYPMLLCAFTFAPARID